MWLLPTGVSKGAAARAVGTPPAAAATLAGGATAAINKTTFKAPTLSYKAGGKGASAGELRCMCTVLRLAAPLFLDHCSNTTDTMLVTHSTVLCKLSTPCCCAFGMATFMLLGSITLVLL
jgi:hypothetical protein